MKRKPLITPARAIRAYGSQRALGEALGVTQQAVSRWKLKRAMPLVYQRLAVRLIAEEGRA